MGVKLLAVNKNKPVNIGERWSCAILGGSIGNKGRGTVQVARYSSNCRGFIHDELRGQITGSLNGPNKVKICRSKTLIFIVDNRKDVKQSVKRARFLRKIRHLDKLLGFTPTKLHIPDPSSNIKLNVYMKNYVGAPINQLTWIIEADKGWQASIPLISLLLLTARAGVISTHKTMFGFARQFKDYDYGSSYAPGGKKLSTTQQIYISPSDRNSLKILGQSKDWQNFLAKHKLSAFSDDERKNYSMPSHNCGIGIYVEWLRRINEGHGVIPVRHWKRPLKKSTRRKKCLTP